MEDSYSGDELRSCISSVEPREDEKLMVMLLRVSPEQEHGGLAGEPGERLGRSQGIDEPCRGSGRW